MYRTWVILRHTFLDALVQPIYTLLVLLGLAILVIFGVLPFFTLGEDTSMFKSVGLDVINLMVLVATLFATSRSIYDEIEDRSMLTLMSKPVRKWEVLVGKYLGIIAAALLAVTILGLVLAICTWIRIPTDYTISTNSIDDAVVAQLANLRYMHIGSLIPALLMMWLQISVLAAIGVALSTRFSLVVNLPAVLLFYIAGNLTRFLEPIWDSLSAAMKVLASVLTTLLPFLQHFDIRPVVVGKLAVPGTPFVHDPAAYPMAAVWGLVGLGAIYAICYITTALLAGMIMFRNRELGGAEG